MGTAKKIMGSCATTDEDCIIRCENAEYHLLDLSGIQADKFTRKYTTISIDGEPFKVRTIIYENKSKKTLVMTHGWLMGAVSFFKCLKRLSEHYQIVMFDNCGHGLNT